MQPSHFFEAVVGTPEIQLHCRASSGHPIAEGKPTADSSRSTGQNWTATRIPHGSPKGQWHEMPVQEVKRDLRSWDEAWEAHNHHGRQQPPCLQGARAAWEGHTEIHPSAETKMGKGKAALCSWTQNSGRRATGKRRQTDLEVQRDSRVAFWVSEPILFTSCPWNLYLPQALASSSPSARLLLLPSSDLLQAMVSCTSFHGNQRERSWFPPKSHSNHNFVPSGLFCYLFSHSFFSPPRSTDEIEFILMTQICKAQVSSVSQAEAAISIQMGCLKERQVWTFTSVIFSTEILPRSDRVLMTGQSLVILKQHFSNRCRSVKKTKGCSFPWCPQASLAQQLLCNMLQQRNIF